MSAWQVYKFGGSSLGAERRLPVVLRRVAEARRPLALVVSALGDTTEWLLASGRAAAAGDRDRGRRGRRPGSGTGQDARRRGARPRRQRRARGSVGAHPRRRCARPLRPELRAGARARVAGFVAVGRRATLLAARRGSAPRPGPSGPRGGRARRIPHRRAPRRRHRQSRPEQASRSGATSGLGTARPRRDRVHRPRARRRHHHPRSEWVGLRSHHARRAAGGVGGDHLDRRGRSDDRQSGAGRGGVPRPATHLARGPGAGSLPTSFPRRRPASRPCTS